MSHFLQKLKNTGKKIFSVVMAGALFITGSGIMSTGTVFADVDSTIEKYATVMPQKTQEPKKSLELDLGYDTMSVEWSDGVSHSRTTDDDGNVYLAVRYDSENGTDVGGDDGVCTVTYTNCGEVDGRQINAEMYIKRVIIDPIYNDYENDPTGWGNWCTILRFDGSKNTWFGAEDENPGAWRAAKTIRYRFTLRWADTNKKIDGKFYQILSDIDRPDKDKFDYYQEAWESIESAGGDGFSEYLVWSQCKLTGEKTDDGLKFISCGASKSDLASYRQAGLIAVTNSGQWSGRFYGGYCATRFDVSTGEVPSDSDDEPEKTVVERQDGKDHYHIGDTIDYEVTYTMPEMYSNTYSVFNQLIFTDELPDQVTYNSGSGKMYSGSTDVTSSAGSFNYDSSSNTLTYTFDKSWLKNTDNYNGQTLKMTFSADVTSGNPGVSTASNDIVVETDDFYITSDPVDTPIEVPVLSIDKVAGKYEYEVGDEVTFTITVKETTGKATACDTVVTDTIPSDLSINSVSTSGTSASSSTDGQTITVTASELAAGGTLTITVSCTALESGNTKELYNTASATCTGNDPDNDPAQDDAEVYLNSATLTIDKVADKYEYEVGDTGHFTVTVKNTGDGFARDVVIDDVLPDEMELDYDSVTISGVPDTFTHYVAGTEDPTNELNPDYREETNTDDVTVNKSEDTSNGWKYEINLMPSGATYTITFDAVMTEAGNGKEIVNSASANADNADKVEDDAETYTNTASLTIAKKYINEYQAAKNDNRADNEFRVYEEETGYELVKYQVDVESVGVDGTVAKNATVYDLTLPDGLVLNYDDIEIVETAADGTKTTFTPAGGDGTSFQYKIAGTADPTNELNSEYYGETETRTPVITLTNTGNNWTLSDTYLPSGYKLTITYTCQATEDVNGMEIRNTAKTTCANMTKDSSGEYEILKDTALVYINSPRLVIEKVADSDKYAVGDTITYTISVYNERVGTIARNLVYTDEIMTDGVKLQNTSVCLMDTDGNMVNSGKYDSVIGNNKFTLTTPFHLVVDENYSLWDIDAGKTPEVQNRWNPEYINVDKELLMTIEYQMVVTDKDLAGEDIYNVATAVSDEALLVSDDETVSPHPPEVVPDKEADKAVYYAGEDVTYNIRVTQNEESVIAYNVMIKDQFQEEDCAVINPDTLKVYFNDEDITDSVDVTYTDKMDGFTIATNKDMTHEDVIDVVYVATMRTDLIGYDITNDVVSWADNDPDGHWDSYTITEEPNDPELAITKSSDKDVYKVGETGHYTVTVIETKDDSIAHNVVINDAFTTKGAEMGNLKIFDDDGNDITDDVEIIWNAEDSYTINTNKNLGFEEKFTITYDVLFNEGIEGQEEMINVAAAEADDAPPVETENPVRTPDPELEIEKTSDKEVYTVGDTGHYTVTVTQTVEDSVAREVVISDAFETPGATMSNLQVFDTEGNDITDEVEITWLSEDSYLIETHKSLEYGETFTVTYDVLFNEEIEDESVNVAEADTPSTPEHPPWRIRHKVRHPKPHPHITKDSEKHHDSVGDTEHYTIVVSQDEEEAVAKNVVITDELMTEGAEYVEGTIKVYDKYDVDITDQMVSITIDGQTFEVVTGMDLEYGEFFTVKYDVYYADWSLSGHDVYNVARAFGDNFDIAADNDVDIPDTDLTAHKTCDPVSGSVVYVGDEIAYTIAITNNGGEDVKNVMVRDMIPDHTTYVSSDDGGQLRTIGGEEYITFTIDEIPAGETVTRSFVVEVTGEGYAMVENTAEVKVAEEGDNDWDDGFTPTNTVVHYIPNDVEIPAPELSILKTSDKEVYDISETGHYTVVVTETDEDAIAENVIIKDSLENPKYASIVEGSIKIADNDGNDITDDVTITADESSYEIETNRDLAYHEFFTVTYDVTFTQASLYGTTKNTAGATAENLEPDPEEDEEPRTYTDEEGNALLEFVKTSDPAPGTKVEAGDEIAYTITLTNVSDDTLTNVLVMDEVPYGTTLNEGYDTVTAGDTEYVTFVIESIEAGESADVTFVVTVNEEAQNTVENTALICPAGDDYDPSADPSDTFDPNRFVPSNTIRHPLGQYWVYDENVVTTIAPGLAITKSSDKTTYKVGETGKYRVVVTNIVPDTTAINVVIADELKNEGAKIVKGSITLTDPIGIDITNEVSIEADDTSYYIETGKNLNYGEHFTVNYEVLFEEEFLQNTQVRNVAKAKADNAEALRQATY